MPRAFLCGFRSWHCVLVCSSWHKSFVHDEKRGAALKTQKKSSVHEGFVQLSTQYQANPPVRPYDEAPVLSFCRSVALHPRCLLPVSSRKESDQPAALRNSQTSRLTVWQAAP